jgi:hypothetical protein
MAPAFVLGAVAGFVSILTGRMTSVVDRIRQLTSPTTTVHELTSNLTFRGYGGAPGS